MEVVKMNDKKINDKKKLNDKDKKKKIMTNHEKADAYLTKLILANDAYYEDCILEGFKDAD